MRGWAGHGTKNDLHPAQKPRHIKWRLCEEPLTRKPQKPGKLSSTVVSENLLATPAPRGSTAPRWIFRRKARPNSTWRHQESRTQRLSEWWRTAREGQRKLDRSCVIHKPPPPLAYSRCLPAATINGRRPRTNRARPCDDHCAVVVVRLIHATGRGRSQPTKNLTVTSRLFSMYSANAHPATRTVRFAVGA